MTKPSKAALLIHAHDAHKPWRINEVGDSNYTIVTIPPAGHDCNGPQGEIRVPDNADEGR